MDHFKLDLDESYDTRLCEIYLTSKGKIAFYCTLCEETYKHFQHLFKHNHNEHMESGDHFLEDPDSKEKNEMDTFQFECDERYDTRWCEIYLTSKKRISFHCTLCEDIYKDFSHLFNHYYNEHMELGEDCLEDSDSKEKMNYIPTDDESLSSYVDDFEPEMPVSIEKCLQDDKQEDSTGPFTDKSEYNIRKVRKRTDPRSTNKERKYKCEKCGSSFITKQNLISHQRRHSYQKNYKCPNCDLRFHTTSEVKQHLRSHTEERNFLCSDCGNSFKTKADLTQHIKRHTNTRDFKCSLCDKAFFERKQLNYHMRSHSSTRPFECNTCSATFLRQASLRAHKRVHVRRLKPKCHICEKLFNKEQGLLYHLKYTHKLATAEMLNS